jgi:hypothetical protein
MSPQPPRVFLPTGAIRKTTVSATAISAMTRSCAFRTAYRNSFSKSAANCADTNGSCHPTYCPSFFPSPAFFASRFFPPPPPPSTPRAVRRATLYVTKPKPSV